MHLNQNRFASEHFLSNKIIEMVFRRGGIRVASCAVFFEDLLCRKSEDMAAVKHAKEQDSVECSLHCGLFKLPAADYLSYLSYNTVYMKASEELMSTQLKEAKDDFDSRGRIHCHADSPYTKKKAEIISEWLRLCVTASIDARKRLWTPDAIVNYEDESKYLLAAVSTIIL